MDPFLEDRTIFPDFHDRLIGYLSESLNERLPPPYYTGMGSRVWVEMSRRRVGPDVGVMFPRTASPGGWSETAGGGTAVVEEVHTEPVVVHVPREEVREPFLEIYARQEDKADRLVTSLEVLSLTNKTPGEHGRDLYLQKQDETLNSKVHLVEIDLLRGGMHTTAVPLDSACDCAGAFDYHVCVHRFEKFDDYFVYPIRLGQKLPHIVVPLLPEDPAVTVDLQAVLDRCYDVGLYARRVLYRDPPPLPPLLPEQSAWIEQKLRSSGVFGSSANS